MSIQELQSTLREHAAAVSDDLVVGRAAAARQRGRTIRRRQKIALLAAAAVIVPLVGAAMLGANPLDRAAPPMHEPEPTPTVEAAFAGRDLLDSEVAQDKAELTLTRDTDVPTQWTVSCYGVGSEFTVSMTLDGDASEAMCEVDEPSEPQMGYVLDRRYPAGTHTLHVWLTRRGSTEIVPVPGSVLTAGVYQLPAPVAVVAGADVFELERVYLGDWRYVGSRESEPGQRRLVAVHESDDTLLARVVAGVPARSVRLFVDGVESRADEALIDSGGYLHVLPAGRHTVELRITGDVPPSARMSVVWRTLTP